jgi:DNA-binding MarR family transcriptional regulator
MYQDDHLSKIGAPSSGHIPGILLWQASKLWQYTLNNALSPLGLSGTSAAVLANVLYFDQEGEQATQVGVAAAVKIDVMTASRIIRALEKKELLIRHTNPKDSRAYSTQLTELGRQTAKEAIHKIMAAHEVFFVSLEANGQRKEFVEILDELVRINDKT